MEEPITNKFLPVAVGAFLLLVPDSVVAKSNHGGSHAGGSHIGGGGGSRGGAHVSGFHGGGSHAAASPRGRSPEGGDSIAGPPRIGFSSGDRFRGRSIRSGGHTEGGWSRGGWIIWGGPFLGGWGWWCPYENFVCYGPWYGPGYAPVPRDVSQDWAVVDMEIWPETAQVVLDGRFIGTAKDFDGDPDYLYLKPGTYELELRLEGYEPMSAELEADAGARVEVNRKLHRIPGAATAERGKAPQTEGGVRHYWGVEGGKLRSYDENRKRTESGRDESSAASTLVLSVEPGDAVVYVDGRFAGTGDELSSHGGLTVSPGHHILSVARPHFASQSIDVNVSPGESKKVEISLQAD